MSREDRDDFGYVRSFPAERAGKMRELLLRAITINPSYADSYELLAFINVVNNENLDEAATLITKAIRLEPGNERFLLRLADIYSRQEKYANAGAIVDRIAANTDDQSLKEQADYIKRRMLERQEIEAHNKEVEKQYNQQITAGTDGAAGGATSGLSRRRPPPAPMGNLTPEQIAALKADAELRSINQSLRVPAANEKQLIAHIQKVECKGKTIVYTVKTAEESLTLTSRDFENLDLVAFMDEALDISMNCGVNVARFNSVLLFKPSATVNSVRGELIGVYFVPENFRFMAPGDDSMGIQITSIGGKPVKSPPPLSPAEDPSKTQNLAENNKQMMFAAIKQALRVPLAGEQREIGFLEKIDCDKNGTIFNFKTTAANLRLKVVSQESLKIRGFTNEIENLQIGCGIKPIEIPVIFTFKPLNETKIKSNGELFYIEFVPKGFQLY